MKLASKVKKIREGMGQSQSQFAKEIGVPLKTLQAWEQGVRQPRGLALEMLTQKLDKLKGR